jgi:predicted O-methyltransferase YrrM
VVRTRHEFLAALHALLHPGVYLEIGVQHGTSLALAGSSTRAVGIDPAPMLSGPVPAGAVVVTATSDDFFGDDPVKILDGAVDLAFIDGMHLFEFALRDFINVEGYAAPDAVVVFDDVLPRNQQEASRTPCPGDWTGDVWRVHPYLARYRPDLDLILVDTAPTGVLVVRGVDRTDSALTGQYLHDLISEQLYDAPPVPERVLSRADAVQPEVALQRIHEGRAPR